MSSRNAVDVILNRGLDRQNNANRMNACNVANLSCSLGSSLIQDQMGLGVTGKPRCEGGPPLDGPVITVNNVIYDRLKKNGTGSEIIHCGQDIGQDGKRPRPNKSNRATLFRFIKQQADIINDLDE